MRKVFLIFMMLFVPFAAHGADVSAEITLEEVNRVKKMSVQTLKAKIDKGEGIVIFDVRTGASWENSKIKVKGAIRVPFQDFAAKAPAQIPFGSEVVTYCT